jgi:hypothetical protein
MPGDFTANPMPRKRKPPSARAKLMGTRDMSEEQDLERRLVT